jgi:hypothetical protein
MSAPIMIALVSAHMPLKLAAPFAPSKSKSSRRTFGLRRTTSSLSALNLSIIKAVLTKPFSPCFQEESLSWQALAIIKLFVMVFIGSN